MWVSVPGGNCRDTSHTLFFWPCCCPPRPSRGTTGLGCPGTGSPLAPYEPRRSEDSRQPHTRTRTWKNCGPARMHPSWLRTGVGEFERAVLKRTSRVPPACPVTMQPRVPKFSGQSPPKVRIVSLALHRALHGAVAHCPGPHQCAALRAPFPSTSHRTLQTPSVWLAVSAEKPVGVACLSPVRWPRHLV
jgi:hypothetical protein